MGGREVLRREKENRALGMFRIKRKKKEDLALHAGDHCRADVRKYKHIRKSRIRALFM